MSQLKIKKKKERKKEVLNFLWLETSDEINPLH